MPERGERLHRYSALALLLLAVYLVHAGVVVPALDARQEAARKYSQALDTLKRYRHLARVLPREQWRSELLRKVRLDEQDLLSGETPPLAAAKLQQLLRKAVRQSGASLVSIQTLNAPPEEGFIPVTLRIILRAGNEALFRLLHRLEGMRPRGLIKALVIHRGGHGSGPVIPAGRDRLNVTLEYTAYMVAG